MNLQTLGLTEEAVSEQIQRRYFFNHISKLVDLCYGNIVASNSQRLDEQILPSFVNCVNKLNKGI